MRVPGQLRAGTVPLRDANRWVLALLLCASAIIGGCAAAQDFAGIPRAGFQKDGTYVVSTEEEKLACRQIKERIGVLSGQLQALPAKAAWEEQQGPTTVGSALGRMFGGPGAGLPSTTEFQRASAESQALQALAVKKQCV